MLIDIPKRIYVVENPTMFGWITGIKTLLMGNMWMVYLVAAAGIFVAGFGTGWTVNGWRLGHEVDQLKIDQADTRAKAAENAVADLIITTQNINKAADEYIKLKDATTGQLNQLRKELKDYAAKTPLPTDCHPDDVRMRKLSDAVTNANAALVRLQPSQ